WLRGARHFMRHLVDGDLANNQHGWQWTAGTGTDAAPYYRILNPVTQSQRFDPSGAYIRQWIPELKGLDAPHIHTPWESPDGPPNGYPDPIVNHEIERRVALEMYRTTSDDA
ncbi:MAG: FAD-binding domain-containing protein, partial [Microbacteriaceae bacterium]